MSTPARRIHAELPIFRLDRGKQSFLYVPGHSHHVSPAEADALQDWFACAANRTLQSVLPLAATLEEQARLATDKWRRLSADSYAPVCLTVYLSNRCNLQCSYCFSSGDRCTAPSGQFSAGKQQGGVGAERVVEAAAVQSAATLVAENAAGRGKPLTVVFHGGGEPTLHWQLLQRLVSITREVAAQHGIAWWGYIATNGFVSEAKARWLARNFDLVGLSCDGPPDIHDAQRPTLSGRRTSHVVARTGRAIAQSGMPFVVRTTITPETMGRQSEIVRYIAATFGARTLHFEPVYGVAGTRHSGFVPDDAGTFVREFLAARELASALGCDLKISGARTDEIHGPYCNVLRDVLQITPDTLGSACFTTFNGATEGPRGVGEIDAATGRFGIDMKRAGEMRARASSIPAQCERCVNVYHCVRQCPERCALVAQSGEPDESDGFRCRVFRQLAENWICRLP